MFLGEQVISFSLVQCQGVEPLGHGASIDSSFIKTIKLFQSGAPFSVPPTAPSALGFPLPHISTST